MEGALHWLLIRHNCKKNIVDLDRVQTTCRSSSKSLLRFRVIGYGRNEFLILLWNTIPSALPQSRIDDNRSKHGVPKSSRKVGMVDGVDYNHPKLSPVDIEYRYSARTGRALGSMTTTPQQSVTTEEGRDFFTCVNLVNTNMLKKLWMLKNNQAISKENPY